MGWVVAGAAAVCSDQEDDVGCEERVLEAELRACELRVGRLAVEVLVIEGGAVEDAAHVTVELLQSSLRAVLQVTRHRRRGRRGGGRADEERMERATAAGQCSSSSAAGWERSEGRSVGLEAETAGCERRPMKGGSRG